MPAKAETSAQIRELTNLATGVVTVPLIETAAGMAPVQNICAVAGVVRLAFGSIDFAAQLGIDPAQRDALLHARSVMVLAPAMHNQTTARRPNTSAQRRPGLPRTS